MSAKSNFSAKRILWDVPKLDIDARLFDAAGRKMPARCKLERRVVWNLIAHLGARGFVPFALDDGECVAPTPDARGMMEELFNRDEARLIFKNRDGETRVVAIVLGNSGWDCVSDWQLNKDDADGWNAALEAFDGEDCE